MARSFNGTSQTLVSASPLTLSASNTLTIACWYWWNAYTNTAPQGHMLTYGVPDGATNVWRVIPSALVSAFKVETYRTGALVNNAWLAHSYFIGAFAPGQWVHLIVTIDRTVGATRIMKFYLNAINQTASLAADTEADMAGTNWANATLTVMGYDTTQAYGAGRMAELALWGGVIFSDTQASQLYNSGTGLDARNSTAGAPTYYWQLCGTDSPEPALVGGVNLTLSNAPTAATHPISGATICSAVTPPSGAEHGAGSRSIGVYSPRGTTQPAPSGWA